MNFCMWWQPSLIPRICTVHVQLVTVEFPLAKFVSKEPGSIDQASDVEGRKNFIASGQTKPR